jgi:peptidoglycan hydrolase-like protein with peptidoglycan-binding domain
MDKRKLWARIAASALGAAVALVPAGIASANTNYPSGCSRTTPNPWGNTCTQGQYYVNFGTSVLGVQFVLFNAAMNPGAPDCDFGPQTDAATIRFQKARGLLQDGIVGHNTWTSLQGELTSSGYYQFTSNTWFVLDPYSTPQGYRAMNALGTGGGLCP